VFELPKATVLTAAPLPIAIVWLPAPPKVTVEVVVPVPILTALFEEAFKLTIPPVTVNPAVPVTRVAP
jgi:hypothetical protein